DLVSAGQGNELIAEQRAQEEKSQTLAQAVQEKRDLVLISTQIQQKVRPRVIVSWKDIQREYDRRKAEFNSVATVTLVRLRLPSATEQEKQQVEDVQTRLAKGEDFSSVANSITTAALATLEEKMGPGGITDIEVPENYKSALSGLTVGQTSKPIQVDDSTTVWLHVEKVDQPPGRT